MAKSHWLDPLARKLLLAAGLTQTEPGAPSSQSSPFDPGDPAIERDLLALKLKHNPGLRLTGRGEVHRAAELGWRLDVNRASASDWLRLPGMGVDQVDLLLRLQRGGVQLTGREDLERALDLSPEQVDNWFPLLDFRWYSEPPPGPAQPPRLNLNHAPASALLHFGLSQERCQRLLRERAREPFQDLADLQLRLQLPADLVEQWIGRVRFGPVSSGQAQAGPALPLPLNRPPGS